MNRPAPEDGPHASRSAGSDGLPADDTRAGSVAADIDTLGGALVFATAFLHAQGAAPNAPTSSVDEKFRVYYRCMVGLFFSLRVSYPRARLVCFSDRPPSGIERNALDALGVEHVRCAPSIAHSGVARNAFPGCLYLLDAVTDYARTTTGGVMVMLDSDIVVRGRFDSLIDACLRAGRIGVLEQPFDLLEACNGHSRATLSLMCSMYTKRLPNGALPFLGGELLVVPASCASDLAGELAGFFEWFAGEGRRVFGPELTEEHALSICVPSLGATVSAAAFAKRIWTTRAHTNVDGGERELAIWHLPSQKRTGLSRFCEAIMSAPVLAPDMESGAVVAMLDRVIDLGRWLPTHPFQRVVGPLAAGLRRIR